MNFRESIYRIFETPHTVEDLFLFTQKKKVAFSWIVEAGCHDASDTIEMIKLFQPDEIHAFEPDPAAFKIAKERLESAHKFGVQVSLRQVALMDSDKHSKVNFVGEPGGGSTQILKTNSNDEGIITEAIRLDDLLSPRATNGLLWLDVEGQSMRALRGMTNSLKKITVSKIEVGFRDISPARLTTYTQEIKFMFAHGFNFTKADIRPGMFGGLLFVRKSELNKMGILKALFTLFLTISLHGCIYPLKGKS